MTPVEREQKAQEFTEVLLGKEVCLSDGECDIVQRETVKLLADTERATLERVAQRYELVQKQRTEVCANADGAILELSNIRNEELSGVIVWCRQQAKEIQS